MVTLIENSIILLNFLTFFVMGYDKKSAQANKWRIPEKMLFLLALIGGSAGVWFGMKLFRHKTKHASFVYGISLIVMIQVILLLVLSQ